MADYEYGLPAGDINGSSSRPFIGSVRSPYDAAHEGIEFSDRSAKIVSTNGRVITSEKEIEINSTSNSIDTSSLVPGESVIAEGLAKRDSEAVAYTKSLLYEGDTMVFITAPGSTRYFDPSGFPVLETPQIVHSSKLLATGSKKLTKMFEDWQQHRIRGRKKMRGALPPGIKYVLDLSPPEEGDEAVELTANLSCSVGICEWHTSSERCNAAATLVGGQDEFSTQQAFTSRVPDVSANETDNTGTVQGNHKDTRGKRLVPEYDSARHRAGIVRLLQVIEGVDPRLDSAPKVWTLFELAQYFECPSVVTDWIVAWLLAEPNTQFIEILPEASYKIGFGLRNFLITRAAFSVLVSEEALSIVSRGLGKHDADQKHQNQFGRLKEDIDEDLKTRLEYASRSLIERINTAFNALTEASMQWFDDVLDFQKLDRFEHHIKMIRDHYLVPSWLKAVSDLKEGLRHYVRGRIFSVLDFNFPKHLVDDANKHRRAENYLDIYRRSFLHTYANLATEERIMTRFFWMALLDISFNPSQPANFANLKHRNGKFSPSAVSAQVKAISMDDLGGLKVRVNKAIMEAIELNCYNEGSIPAECRLGFDVPNGEAAHGVSSNNTRSGGIETDEPPSGWWGVSGAVPTAQPDRHLPDSSRSGLGGVDAGNPVSLPVRVRKPEFTPSQGGILGDHKQKGTARFDQIADSIDPNVVVGEFSVKVHDVPADWKIDDISLFFNLHGFMRDVSQVLYRFCGYMLRTNELGFPAEVTDTLLCMEPSEFKFLPLWAGGDDDGSGGVFDQEIPPADMGPIGPGPSFHTGQSIRSAVGSEASFGAGTGPMSFRTSLGAEDGYTEHFDRRRVMSDDGFCSETFSEDSEIYDASDVHDVRNKGKGVDRTQHASYESHDGDDKDSIAPSETISDVTQGYAVSVSDSSGIDDVVDIDTPEASDTATIYEGAEDDDDEMWDASDTESFDFGDDLDETMAEKN